MVLDLIIENGVLVIPKIGLVNGCLGIEAGKIAGIYGSADGLAAREKIDARGLYVLPGLIEPHVHYGYRGNLKGHFQTETASAALGGITTVIPFYRDIENPTGLYENIPDLKAMAEAHTHIDFSLHLLLITRRQLMNVDRYFYDYGIPSFKFYMAYKGEDAKSIGLTGNETDDGFLFEAFSQLAGISGAVACVHAENIEIILTRIKKYKEQGKDGLRIWSECRPNFSEWESVLRAITLAGEAGCPLYVAHLTTQEALKAVKALRWKHKNLYIETCPQYLTLDKDTPLGNLAKVNPPLRSLEDIDALWQGIADGVIDAMGSDHCPFRKEDKEGRIWDAKTGFPGSATMLPVLLNEGVHKRGMSLQRVVEITSYNPARIFHLFPHKGTIQVGSDADLCILDLSLSREVRHQDLLSYSDFSLYEGWSLKGWPVMTLVRGQVVMQEGQITGSPGHGRFVEARFTSSS
ncbi:MAG: amidohydrolase family protein [Desulfobacterales bacterium]|jgi:dihydropyrimidinase